MKSSRRSKPTKLILVKAIGELLFRADPIAINFDTNTDEYRPEAETITLRVPEAANEEDLLKIVHEEFVRWFGESTAGSIDRYGPIAGEIWSLANGRSAR